MEQGAEHTDPSAALFEVLSEQIAERVSQHILQAMPKMDIYTSPDIEPATLQPFYKAKDLAERWGLYGADAVHAIPEMELPRRRVGPARGSTRFYWLDVLVYEGTLTRDQADALQERQLEVLEDSQAQPARVWKLRDALDEGAQ